MKKRVVSIITAFFVISALFFATYAKNKEDKLGKLGLKYQSLAEFKKEIHGEKKYTEDDKNMVNEKLPTKVDLSKDMPKPGNQGNQMSCTAFAVGYAMKTFQEVIDQHWKPDTENHIFSPSFIYNQINGGNDDGSTISDAFNLLMDKGCTTLSDMPYNETDFTTQPTEQQLNNASKYKSMSIYYAEDSSSIKAWLANRNNPVIIGIPVYPDFYNIGEGNEVYDNTDGTFAGNHAICIVGYDDEKGFKFINSWGEDKQLSGYGYISYDMIDSDFNSNREATGYMCDDIQDQDSYVKFSKVTKPSKTNKIGNQWKYNVKSPDKKGTTLKVGDTLYTESNKLYIKVVEDDKKYDDVTVKNVTLKEGTNNIKVTVKENAGDWKGKKATLTFKIVKK